MLDIAESECARECFQTAGCSSFYYDGECHVIIGRASANPLLSSAVSAAGQLNDFCPENPFVGSFTKESEFFCKFLTTLQADDLIDLILERNNVDSATVVLGEWMIENDNSNGVFKATSTKVTLSSGNPYGEATEEQGMDLY